MIIFVKWNNKDSTFKIGEYTFNGIECHLINWLKKAKN